ncbi:uncharacterized protein KY384_001911 [Bacidia gigantensis]|uniref:uncharacterized protein n=1 Tax=Bacidia gigantensis TaxID=2732470 RepID=UPI001D057A70|nr:uncharacterized protein KY384_001911 [Bacidia gigantensis]KAG8533128.1 hypothetical protein KY384_001911 [Bacidia gigantensis]
MLGFYSYRDPNPQNTLNVIRDVGRFAIDKTWTDQDLQEAKLSTFQSVDAPQSVSEEGLTRADKKEQLLDVTKQDVRAVAQKYLVNGAEEMRIAAIGEKKDWIRPEEWKIENLDQEQNLLERVHSTYKPLHTFALPHGDHKQYKQQYGDMYFLRLAKLKPAVEELAQEAWNDFQIAGEQVRHVDRVLDVRQGELCWVAGTVFMDMPLKPNILDDLSRDHWIAAPPPREKYLARNGQDLMMLEDESGRLRMVGTQLQLHMLVTGCIIAVMGTENADGDFEVVDMKVPDLAPQPERQIKSESLKTNGESKSKRRKSPDTQEGSKIAIVSGIAISGEDGDSLKLDLLMEFLLGEACGTTTQEEISKISRLIIAGNSISEGNPLRSEDDLADLKKASKKYGYDSSAYNPLPTAHLDEFLATLLPSIPITLLPGDSDPANVSLPQQPIHPAMLPRSRNYAVQDGEQPGWFDSVTNPWEGDIDGLRFLGNGGQPIDDVLKYVEGGERLEMIENLLRWRCNAPTAPDTLWCYPFQEKDQFIIEECPHVFFVGNQPRFETGLVEGPTGQIVRLIAVPKFKETGEVVLLDTETLEAEMLKFNIHGDL